MSYSHPVIKTESLEIQNIIRDEVESIITQQIVISQLANGISYQDTENMDAYERTFIYSKLIEMKQEENNAKLKAIEEAKQNRSSAPKASRNNRRR